VPLIAGAHHLAPVITWKPLAGTTVATSLWIALAVRPSGLLLSIAAAAVAAPTSQVLDDPAAATLQPSPTTLLRRRAQRVTLALPLLGLWWALTTTIVSRSAEHLPLGAHTLQYAALVAIGLTGSSLTSRIAGDRAREGTTGALAVIICFGTGFLPARSLQLVPVDPAAPGATRQLAVLLAIAVALQFGSSADPAQRHVRGRRRRDSRAARSAPEPAGIVGCVRRL
jgi:hypothetical protein